MKKTNDQNEVTETAQNKQSEETAGSILAESIICGGIKTHKHELIITD